MRKLLLAITGIVAFAGSAKAQGIATFENLNLPTADTFYINMNNPETDQGFNDDELYFQYVYDTSYGGLWSSGFIYSNVVDSVTSGYTNQYAAKPGAGANGSSQYGVFWQGYGAGNKITNVIEPLYFDSMYVTNSTYASNDMRDGDGYAKKFGGVDGTDPDFFLLTIYRYLGGVRQSDSVNFYLADFRDTNSANDYIVNDWRKITFPPFWVADSLEFRLTSSDNDSLYGMKTPAYFALDNLSWRHTESIPSTLLNTVKVFPIPATTQITIDDADIAVQHIRIMDMMGRTLVEKDRSGAQTTIPLYGLAAGTYVLQLSDKLGKFKSKQFQKL